VFADSVTQFLRGRPDLSILPAASIQTVLSGPGNYLKESLHPALIAGKHERRQKNGIEIITRGEYCRIRSKRCETEAEDGFYQIASEAIRAKEFDNHEASVARFDLEWV
jgi:hypothetical protein